MKLEGVFVATVTPFTADGTLDTVAYRSLLKNLVQSEVHGLVPCGTTGESPTLTDSERVQLIEACLDLAGDRTVVLAGCGGNSTQTVLGKIQEAESLGCAGTLVVTPYYNKPTPAGVLAHYLFLADRCSKPIVLYHVPGRTNVTIPLDVVSRLFEHPNIAGIKEASGNYAYWLGLCQLAKQAGKAVLSGDDDAVAVIEAFGGTGVVSAAANGVPAAYVRLHRFMQEGQWKEAFALQQRLAPLVRALFAETNPGPLKYALHRYAGMENRLRLPLVPVSSATERLIVAEWERFHSEALQ